MCRRKIINTRSRGKLVLSNKFVERKPVATVKPEILIVKAEVVQSNFGPHLFDKPLMLKTLDGT